MKNNWLIFVFVFGAVSANATEIVRPSSSHSTVKFKVMNQESSDAPSNKWVRYSLMLSSKTMPSPETLRTVAEGFMRSRRGDGYKVTVLMYLPGMIPGEEAAYSIARYSATGSLIDFVTNELFEEQKSRIQMAMKKLNQKRFPANE